MLRLDEVGLLVKKRRVQQELVVLHREAATVRQAAFAQQKDLPSFSQGVDDGGPFFQSGGNGLAHGSGIEGAIYKGFSIERWRGLWQMARNAG